MDALDKMIAEKCAERDDLRRRAELLEAEILALETAAQLRPSTKSSPRAKKSGAGRTKGAISKTWRDVLERMHQGGGAYDYDAIARITEELGNELAIASVRDRVRNLVKTDLLSGDPDNGFAVTEEAVERFGFTNGNPASVDAGEANAGSARYTSGVLNLQPRPPGQ